MEDFKHKNPDYDIIEVYDGSSIENVSDVFKKKFKAEGLEKVWERVEE